MSYYAQELQWLGAGKETNWGTAVSSTYFIPFTDIKPADVPTVVKDAGTRGVMSTNFAQAQSIRNSTFEAGGAVYPDSFGLILLSMLNKDTVTGTTTKTHTFVRDPVTQPSSYTLNYYNPAEGERAFAGMKCEELDLKWAKNAALEYTWKLQGKTSSLLQTPETPSLTTVDHLMSWAFALTLFGTADVNMESFELNIKRKLSLLHVFNGTQDPGSSVVGGLDVSGKATFDMQDGTELLNALNNTQGALVFSGTQAGTNYGLSITLPKTAFETPTVQGKSYMQVDESFTGLYDATAGNELSIALMNNVASY